MLRNFRLKLKLKFLSLKRQRPSLSTFILFTISLSLMAFYTGFKMSGITDLAFEYHPKTSYEMKKAYQPAQVKIDSLSINLPVEQMGIIGDTWQTSKNGVAHLTSSSVPGQGSNIVLYGHNKRAIFGSLPWIKLGQTITIITYEGKIYTYAVIEKKIVSPSHIEVIQPTNEELLTLFTCTGFADSKRLVVLAKPIPSAKQLSSLH